MTTFTSSELMTVHAARLLRDGDVVFVGVGLPNLACNLARRTHAPNLVMIYEDDGKGISPSETGGGIGLRNIRERAHALRASFHIGNGGPRGILATLRVPIG